MKMTSTPCHGFLVTLATLPNTLGILAYSKLLILLEDTKVTKKLDYARARTITEQLENKA